MRNPVRPLNAKCPSESVIVRVSGRSRRYALASSIGHFVRLSMTEPSTAGDTVTERGRHPLEERLDVATRTSRIPLAWIVIAQFSLRVELSRGGFDSHHLIAAALEFIGHNLDRHGVTVGGQTCTNRRHVTRRDGPEFQQGENARLAGDAA